MIPHKTTTMILKACEELLAPPEGGAYISLFAHALTKEQLDRLAYSEVRSFEKFLKLVERFAADGNFALWKGGEVKGNNRFFNRLDTLSSAVNTGRKDLPAAKKMHERVVAMGGFVHVIMIPVAGFSDEKKMMAHLAQKYDIEFDNYGRDRNVTKPIKKVKGTCAPYKFTV